jgi:3-hydroxyisobutyrate dehydrogenase
MKQILTVAFIGIGNMGLPMVMNLLKAGIEVHIYDLKAIDNIQKAKEAGAIHEKSLMNFLGSAPFILSMLPSGEVLRELLFGKEQGHTHIQPNAIVIDLCTANPTHTQATDQDLRASQIHFLDAPVMGGVAFAKDGTLDFLVGGDLQLIERCKPIFNALGRSVTHCGPIGSGHAMKALTNYINAAAMMNVVEAIQIGKSFGIDENLMAQSLIETCTGRNHPIIKKVIPKILTETYDSGMGIGLLEKDLKIAKAIAIDAQGKHPLLDKTLEILSSSVNVLGPSVDQTEIAKFWKK